VICSTRSTKRRLLDPQERLSECKPVRSGEEIGHVARRGCPRVNSDWPTRYPSAHLRRRTAFLPAARRGRDLAARHQRLGDRRRIELDHRIVRSRARSRLLGDRQSGALGVANPTWRHAAPRRRAARLALRRARAGGRSTSTLLTPATLRNFPGDHHLLDAFEPRSSGAITWAPKPIELDRLRAEMIFSSPVKAPTCRNSCCGCLRPP
jgi:hypothetical protein